MDTNIYYDLVLSTNIDRDIKPRHTRESVVKYLKRHKLNISPSKLIKLFRERNVGNMKKGYYTRLDEIITELKRDSVINKMIGE